MKIEEEIEEAKKLFTWEGFIEYIYEPEHKTVMPSSLLHAYLVKINVYKRKNMVRREASRTYR